MFSMFEIITRWFQKSQEAIDLLTPQGQQKFTAIYNSELKPLMDRAFEMNKQLQAEVRSLTKRLSISQGALSHSEKMCEALVPEIERIQEEVSVLGERLQSAEAERDTSLAETRSLRAENTSLRARAQEEQRPETVEMATQTTGNAYAVVPINSRMAMPVKSPQGFKYGAATGVRVSYGYLQAHAGVNALYDTQYGFDGFKGVRWKPVLEVEYSSDTAPTLGPFLRGNLLSTEGSLGYEISARGLDFQKNRSSKLIASRDHVFAKVETQPGENGILMPLVKNLQELNVEVGILKTVPTSKADVVMRAPLVRVRDVVHLAKHGVDTMQSSLAVPAAPIQSKTPPRRPVGDGFVIGFTLLATVGVLWNRVRSRAKTVA